MIFANEYRKFYIVCKIIVGVMVSNKNYVKRGPSFREVLRCPLCGKLSRIGFLVRTISLVFIVFVLVVVMIYPVRLLIRIIVLFLLLKNLLLVVFCLC